MHSFRGFRIALISTISNAFRKSTNVNTKDYCILRSFQSVFSSTVDDRLSRFCHGVRVRMYIRIEFYYSFSVWCKVFFVILQFTDFFFAVYQLFSRGFSYFCFLWFARFYYFKLPYIFWQRFWYFFINFSVSVGLDFVSIWGFFDLPFLFHLFLD